MREPIGPCLCGDTECPSCGTAQGTYTGRRTRVLTIKRCGAIVGYADQCLLTQGHDGDHVYDVDEEGPCR